MVQRYDCYGLREHEMHEVAVGPFVKYEDYAKLELKLIAIESHLERALNTSKQQGSRGYISLGYIEMALRMLNNDN